jgi:hypothetical protein
VLAKSSDPRGDGGQILIHGKGGRTRVVREASQRAGIAAKVSTHWLRHAHASTRLIAAHRFIWCRPRWDTGR